MGTEYVINGKINRRNIYYAEAYRLAVQGGYKGSVEEWLAEIERKVDAGEATSGEYNALLDYKKRERYMKG
jgi:hypothetical protein